MPFLLHIYTTKELKPMPTYIFRNTLTGEVREKYLGMSELDQYKFDNKHLVQMPVLINTVGQIGDIKMDQGFKDVMNSISKNNPGSNMRNY